MCLEPLPQARLCANAEDTAMTEFWSSALVEGRGEAGEGGTSTHGEQRASVKVLVTQSCPTLQPHGL